MAGLLLGVIILIFHRLSGVNCADLILNPNEMTVKKFVHDSFYINCNHNNATGIAWFKNNQPISRTASAARLYVEPGFNNIGLSLIFADMVASDTGVYTCKAKINNKERQTSFKLIVFTPVSFADTPTIQNVVEGETATIRCEAKGDPEPTIKLSSPDVDIYAKQYEDKYKVLADGLSISKVTRQDGNYTFICKALQSSADISNIASRNIKLNVLYKPHSDYQNKTMDVYGYVGGTTNIVCAVDANPPANFTWYNERRSLITPNNNTVKILHENNKSILRISNFNKNVLGGYICKAKNSRGEIERKFKLNEGAKPEPPKKAKLHSATHNSLKLEIHSPEDKQLKIIGFKVQILEKKEKEKGKGWEVAREVELPKGKTNVYIIPDLSPNTEYLIRVHSLNEAGPSDYTNEIKAQTSDSSKFYVSNVLIFFLLLASRFT